MGWIAPLGTGLEEIWDRLRNGDQADVREITKLAALEYAGLK